jgi:hypothetical protein
MEKRKSDELKKVDDISVDDGRDLPGQMKKMSVQAEEKS